LEKQDGIILTTNHHNILWVSLTTGSCMTPFWWAFSPRMNDVAVSNQLLNIRRFTDNIAFARMTNFRRVDVIIPDGDGFGMQSDQLTYGWVVNVNTDVAGDAVTVSSMADGKYKLKLFHTWRGAFIDEKEVSAADGKVTFTIPILHTTGSHANYIGADIAFTLERIIEKPVMAEPKKKKKK
jgi:hypothetical protein